MLSRRTFIRDSLAIVSLGLGVPSVFSRAVVASAAEKSSRSVSGKTLIVVQLAGGMDGLNVVVPYTDPLYRSMRPTVGVPEANLLPIDDRFAFHSAFREMKGLFSAGQLAVIQGVGYPEPNFSHFKAMDIWQSADPEGAASDGWLGRYFEGMVDDDGHPLSGLNIGRRLPSAFESSDTPIPAIESLETFGLQNAADDTNPDAREQSMLKLYELYRPTNAKFAALLDSTLDDALRSSADLAAAHSAYKPAVTYPQSSLASGLQLLAELIDANDGQSPLRVGHVMLDGFDTHTQETERLETLLAQTSQALAAFWQDIVAHGHGDDVLIMTWSEFGRRVRENGQDGTDHGWAVPMFLIGNAVVGGLHGESPSLSDLERDNLRYTTDFRSVYATVLENWLDAPSEDILRGRFEPLKVLRV